MAIPMWECPYSSHIGPIRFQYGLANMGIPVWDPNWTYMGIPIWPCPYSNHMGLTWFQYGLAHMSYSPWDTHGIYMASPYSNHMGPMRFQYGLAHMGIPVWDPNGTYMGIPMWACPYGTHMGMLSGIVSLMIRIYRGVNYTKW